MGNTERVAPPKAPEPEVPAVAATPDHAREYVPPTTVPPPTLHKTFEMETVQLAPDVDPRRAKTLRMQRKAGAAAAAPSYRGRWVFAAVALLACAVLGVVALRERSTAEAGGVGIVQGTASEPSEDRVGLQTTVDAARRAAAERSAAKGATQAAPNVLPATASAVAHGAPGPATAEPPAPSAAPSAPGADSAAEPDGALEAPFTPPPRPRPKRDVRDLIPSGPVYGN
jgi:hypothetical protein